MSLSNEPGANMRGTGENESAETLADFGIIGLGVMGQNLAANVASRGFSVATFDPWESARTGFGDGELYNAQ